MRNLLTQIEALLRKYEFVLEANRVATALELVATRPEKACMLMIQDNWWIGEDAIAEAELSIAGGFTPEARQDQQQFQQLIIRLYKKLLREGYESDLARLVTSQFQKWQISGM